MSQQDDFNPQKIPSHNEGDSGNGMGGDTGGTASGGDPWSEAQIFHQMPAKSAT